MQRISYTPQEYFRMTQLYVQCGRNANAAARLYADRYPPPHPWPKTISSAVRRGEETGNVETHEGINGGGNNGRRILNNECVNRIINIIEEEPATSTRRVAQQIGGISHVTVHRICKKEGLHPYHRTPVQLLHEGDKIQRLRFCRWLVERYEENEFFVREILFTDESLFNRRGIFNQHNEHFYSRENPHVIKIRNVQRRFSVNLWCGILGERIVSLLKIIMLSEKLG